MKKLFLALLAFAAAFSIMSCTGGADDAMEWNIGADPKTLDPGLNGASDGGDVINNTFEGLVREKNGVVYPGMAESWTVSADGLTYTFTIRANAKWSDGSKLTADDFVRSWLRGMDPRNASEYSWIWEYTNVVGANEFVFADAESTDAQLDTLKAAVGIKSLEEGAKFEVKLTAPTNWFVSLMAFYHFMPVPASATIEGEGAWAKNPETAISNGPFHLTYYKVGEKLTLEKNKHYWNNDEVGIEKINGYFIDLATTAYARYEAGTMDVLNDVPSQMIPGLAVASQEFYNFALLGTYYANFNLSGTPFGGTRDIGDRDNEILGNANLRKAMALSIDRTALTEAIATGAIPAAGFIPKGFADHNGEDFWENTQDHSEIVADDGSYELAVTYFETAANELFPEATDPVQALRDKLETMTYLYNTSEAHQQIGELMQEMWADNLGFTIQLGNEEWATFQDTRTDGAYDISRGGWLTDFMDPSGMIGIFTQGNAYNDPDYYNADFEAKLEEAREATTAAAHFEALYEAHEIFMDDMPIIPIYHYSDVLLVKARIVGWSRSVLGTIDFSTAKFAEE
jgi:oligopeptide transport system substrate-binding protein